jgi:hypothetical protein
MKNVTDEAMKILESVPDTNVLNQMVRRLASQIVILSDGLNDINDVTMSQCVDYKHMVERTKDIASNTLNKASEV